MGSSDFVEKTLKQAGEAYDRRMRSGAEGVDLSAVISAVCRDLEVDEKDLAGATKRFKVTHARALVSHIARSGLSISGSEVAGRLQVDRSAVCRAAQRVMNDPEMTETAKKILEQLER